MSRALGAAQGARSAPRRPSHRADGTDPADALPKSAEGGYLEHSARPLTSLVFLLPLIVIYEIGTWHFATDPWGQTERRIRAFEWMQRFFNLFGATGRYLPALAIVGILLTWHIARRDPWRVRGSTLTGMAVEGCAWALPLLAYSLVAVRLLEGWLHALLGAPVFGSEWRALLVLSVGAGLYEELVFRLGAFTLLSLLLVDLLRMRKLAAYPLMIGGAALGFALYHYWGGEPVEWQSLVFRTCAGAYFGAIFLWRGFGITAFSHAIYDVFVVLLKWASAG